MEIGTGIFLSSIFIGLVGLYAITKDRWKWKRIFLWTLGTVAIAVVAIGGWVWYIDNNDQQADRPQVVDELWGLKLGMTEADVRFRKGEPTLLKEPAMWAYAPDAHSPAYRIAFRDNAVWLIEAVKLSKASLPEIQGIFESTTQEQLEKRFGKPDNVTTFDDGFGRALSFNRHNVRVSLKKNQVTAIGIFDGSTDPFKTTTEGSEAHKK